MHNYDNAWVLFTKSNKQVHSNGYSNLGDPRRLSYNSNLIICILFSINGSQLKFIGSCANEIPFNVL